MRVEGHNLVVELADGLPAIPAALQLQQRFHVAAPKLADLSTLVPRTKVDRFVPHTEHVNLSIVGRCEFRV